METRVLQKISVDQVPELRTVLKALDWSLAAELGPPVEIRIRRDPKFDPKGFLRYLRHGQRYLRLGSPLDDEDLNRTLPAVI